MRDNDDDEPLSLGFSTCVRQTDKAVLCFVRSLRREIWVPQSVVHDDSEVYEVGGEGNLVVVRWWAEKEGLA